MPVFHTKTIESILEPVAQQVSRLVIIHEEAEDGNAMPDLTVPVFAVSKAVQNLVKVGRETINNSDDLILKQDMPGSLIRVEKSYKLLEEACDMLKNDPFSQPARKKLIESARGILGGVSSLLLCFDESEVRKIIKQCKKVLEYLTVAEVIESINDLVQFVKDMSPCLTRVSRDVDSRQKELTHNIHRDVLIRCLDSVKTLAPILICSMKIYVQLLPMGKKTDEAVENRNYLVSRMTDEINEIIRVLQLTTSDDDKWDEDNLAAIRKALAAILAKMQLAHDFLENPSDLVGGIGEKSLRSILDLALKIADYCQPATRVLIRKQVSDLKAMVDALCELRSNGNGTSPQAQSMSKSINNKLKQLVQLIETAIKELGNEGIKLPKQTLQGRFEQAMAWLTNPAINDQGLGMQAINSILEEAKQLANDYGSYSDKEEMYKLCNDIKKMANDLNNLCISGLRNSSQAKTLAKELIQKLLELKAFINRILIDQLVRDFVDIHTPLKQFVEAVLAPIDAPNREKKFEEKARNLQNFSNAAVKIAREVAKKSACNKRISDNLLKCASDVESLCPQLINAGTIRFNHPDNKLADEHFNNLQNQYAESLQRLRNLFDEAIDTNEFVKGILRRMKNHSRICENAISDHNAKEMADNVPIIARLSNRLLNKARQEAENSEDPVLINKLNRAAVNLKNCISPMVTDATRVIKNVDDPNASNDWLNSNRKLINAAEDVKNAIIPDHLYDTSKTSNEYVPPPIPKLPSSGLGQGPPPRPPPPPETDDEFEERFPSPSPNQPIMMAAHGLHQEVKDWSSKDNEIIAAAKKMALLMARLSQLVRGEGGTKKDLIDCAKAIAEASKEVSRLAKEQAKLCTDKRMRTAILQVCERIPTIGTQLSILSTVKATMLGSQASEEDREATEMLEGNAQNLMQSVKETVRACEAASIKIRTDAGVCCIWRRKNPWYQ